MKKIIFGIFAHPDDEAFGPSGALLLETKSGNELHLITLTNGSAGTNPDNLEDLGKTRLIEWQEAGKLLGATTHHHLGLPDGELNNQRMLQAAAKIEKIVANIVHEHTETVEIEFMTLDLNGLTGHIDHIVAARAACLAFYRLKQTSNNYQRIRFACLPQSQFPRSNIDWLYMEAGHPLSDIDQTIDARQLQDAITKIVRTHTTQRKDGETFLHSQGDSLGLCYFIVKT